MNEQADDVQLATRPLTHTWKFGGVQCDAFCIAPPDEHDWSWKDLYTPESGATSFGEKVSDELYAHGVRGAVYAPTVTGMNARIIEQEELTTKIPLSHGIVMWRNKLLKADGVDLDPDRGDSFGFTGGGCLLAVAISSCGVVLAAHISRDSLFDRERIRTGKQSRQYESVLHAMAARFREWGIPPKQVEVRVYFSGPKGDFKHEFDDPTWGEQNRALYNDVCRRRLGQHVMQIQTGCLSVAAACVEINRREIGFARLLSECKLPFQGDFAYTRHPTLDKKRNLEGVVVRRI